VRYLVFACDDTASADPSVVISFVSFVALAWNLSFIDKKSSCFGVC
jgi:hypothetical protein